jgi:hypothetical protein
VVLLNGICDPASRIGTVVIAVRRELVGTRRAFDERGGVGIRLEPAAAIVRQYRDCT